MTHSLLTRAETVRDGVIIALKAVDIERRKKALEATRRAASALMREIGEELLYLDTTDIDLSLRANGGVINPDKRNPL
jgi:hypothetical protein